MKLAVAVLLLVLPAFLEASPDPKPFLFGHLRPKPRPRPPPIGPHGSCSTFGDPHYVTFDRKRYNFMGTCRYVHVTDSCKRPCGKPVLGNFKVIAENVRCGRSVSCIKSVEVIIRGKKIHLRRRVFNRAVRHARFYSVGREGRYVVVRTKPPGLIVKWDRSMGLHIHLSTRYKRKVCGLCGNFDGNPHNDISKDHVNLRSVRDFTRFWTAGGKCQPAPTVPKHPCEKNPARRKVAEKDCKVIRSKNFKRCKDGGVNTEALYHDCVFDVCIEKVPDKESSCEAIKEAAEECKDRTGKTVSLGHRLEQKCRECQQFVKLFNSCKIKCCVFPFKKDGKTYNKCVNSRSGAWCSSEKNATPDSIGLCQQ